MKNITKIRIFYSPDYKAEKEYLVAFFKYIGLLIDEVETNTPLSFYNIYKDCEKRNDPDGIDIFLNFEYPYSLHEFEYDQNHINKDNRFFFYFKIRQKKCAFYDSVQFSLDLDTIESKDKKQFRIYSLDCLINNIWQNDEENYKAIKQLRNEFVNEKENSDLFYILYAFECLKEIITSYFINRENNARLKHHESPILAQIGFDNNYIENMFIRLININKKLENSDNPYLLYAKINTQRMIMILCSYSDELSKKIILGDYPYEQLQYDILNQSMNLINRYPWLSSAYPLYIELFNKLKFPSTYSVYEDTYNAIISRIENSPTSVYYSYIYLQHAVDILNKYGDDYYTFEKKCQIVEKVIDRVPNNYMAWFNLGLIKAREGKHTGANACLEKIIRFDKNSQYTQYTPKELRLYFDAIMLAAQIAINTNAEYSAFAKVNLTTFIADCFQLAEIIQIIGSENEKELIDFMQYHMYSLPLYAIYSSLEPWVLVITNASEGTKLYISDIIKRWKQPESKVRKKKTNI